MKTCRIGDFVSAWRMLLFIALLVLPACSLFDDDEGEVAVAAHTAQLVISNRTPDVVYYAVFPNYCLSLLDWLPCSDPSRCVNKIQPGRWAVVKYDEFMPERKDDEAVVYWWYSVKKLGDGVERYETDEIRAIFVKL